MEGEADGSQAREGGISLVDMQRAVFRELDNLQGVDMGKPEQVACAVARAHAVRELVGAGVEVANTVIRATKAKGGPGASLPKGLLS